MVLATQEYWLARVKELESDLARALLRVSELEMALDYQMAKAMGKD
jgi:hypothetical protein